ncbi:MAG TPA: hypothetical protein VLZ78_07855 [Terrimesophilobacter sp.]|nr:hypothetical protein [Terrimesophilobacter sp.]
MAYFSDDVLDLLVPSLHDSLTDMTWGESNYGALVGLFRKGTEDGSVHALTQDVNFGGGASATYTDAYNNSTLTVRVQWQFQPFKTYSITTIPLDQDAFTKGPHSAARLLFDESQKCMNQARNQLDVALAGDGYGTLGTIVTPTNTTGSTWTITFATLAEVLKFEPGKIYTSKATAAGASLEAGTFAVTNVQPGIKTITGTSTGMTPTAGHVMGLKGTQKASTAFSVWPGIPAIIPPAANRPVSATTFMNVDRSVSEQKLAGSYLDWTGGGDILQGVLQLESQIANVPGAKPDTLVSSFTNKAKIMASAQTQNRFMTAERVKVPDLAEGIDIYYSVIRIHGTAGGALDIVCSSNWSDTLLAVLDRSTWHIDSPSGNPILGVGSQGNPIVETPLDDACLCRYRVAAFVYTDAAGNNGMLTVSA